MAATVESLLESFPYPTFDPITGEPTYETITAVTRQLKANAASAHSELGGGSLGHLALIMTPPSTLSSPWYHSTHLVIQDPLQSSQLVTQPQPSSKLPSATTPKSYASGASTTTLTMR